jgi:CDP-glucose 4,6-dehydratase
MAYGPRTVEGLALNADFWRGRQVLITGHTGFKGSWLCLWLERLGAQVTGLSIEPPTDPCLFDVARVKTGMTDIRLDIRDPSAVLAAFDRARPSVVFHLAAQPLVRASYESPLETFSTNVMGTAHVLEAVRRCSAVTAAVIVTSDKCYENREIDHAYAEHEPLGGHDPYSSSKACAELVASAYRRSFLSADSGKVATARAGNVIGGGDWAADRLLPDLMRAFAAGTSAPIRNPAAVRPWQHVLEPLSGYLRLAEKLDEHGAPFADAWNFGPMPSDTRSVEDVVSNAAKEWGSDARWCTDQATHPHEAKLLRLDASKARTRLGWQPYWTVETAVRETVRWYKEFARGADMRGLTLAQIASYSEVISERG